MKIENSKKTMVINQLRYIMVIAFIVIVVVLLTTDLIRSEFLGLNKYYWAVIISLLYLGQNIYEYLKDYNYIYFTDENNKILFRYIPLRPFKSKRYSIEINKGKFHGYKIERPSVFKQEIVLFVKTSQGIAKYPPISISALNEEEFNKLKKALNQYIN
ncbi:MAG: hypothetical protein ACQER7_04830 [Bacteroidota bacterium]